MRAFVFATISLGLSSFASGIMENMETILQFILAVIIVGSASGCMLVAGAELFFNRKE